MQFTPRLEQAINKAAYAHRNQTRKGTDLPYIVHPFGVMMIASQVTTDEDILIACLLHDVIEDVPGEYSKAAIREDFGEHVVAIIEGVTKDATISEWQASQDAYLKHLAEEAPDESVLVSCADKIHNLMATLRDYEEVGDVLWERFSAGKARQQWWYEAVLNVIMRRLPDLALNQQLAKLVTRVKAL